MKQFMQSSLQKFSFFWLSFLYTVFRLHRFSNSYYCIPGPSCHFELMKMPGNCTWTKFSIGSHFVIHPYLPITKFDLKVSQPTTHNPQPSPSLPLPLPPSPLYPTTRSPFTINSRVHFRNVSAVETIMYSPVWPFLSKFRLVRLPSLGQRYALLSLHFHQ